MEHLVWEGKVLPGLPCDLTTHFCFLSNVLSTQEAWWGPPLTVLSAAGWTWGPGPTSCVVQDVAFPLWNRQWPRRMGTVKARSYLTGLALATSPFFHSSIAQV